MRQYFHNLIRRIRKLGWVGIVMLVVGELLKDRIIGWGNAMADKVLSELPKVLSLAIQDPFQVVSVIGVIIIVITFVLAYSDTKKNNQSSPKKDYKDIDLTVFDYPWTEHQLNIGADDFANFLKVGLRISNKGNSKIRCALRMMDVKYNGKGVVWNWQDREEWVDAPVPVERKFIKWDEGYNPIDGKIDISPSGGLGNMLFAESNPYSMEFWFWYIDGKSKNHQSLEGKYKVSAQLEGDCGRNGVMSGFQPIPYEIEFTYKRRKLENVRVTKITT
jgi:hypothetical protein